MNKLRTFWLRLRGKERNARFGETIVHDTRFGLRMLKKNPGFTVVAVLLLALGIGASTAIFSVLNAVLFQPLPYKDSARIVKIWMRFTGIGLPNDQNQVSSPEFRDLRELSRSLSDLAVVDPDTYNLGISGHPQIVQGARVSPSLFPVLGVQPSLGRVFLPEEEQQGRDHIVILSHGLWQRSFGGDPAIVGKSIVVNAQTFLVTGVMPPGFAYPARAEMWQPQAFGPDDFSPARRGNHNFEVVARIKPGFSLAQARADMAAVSKTIIERNRDYHYEDVHFAVLLVPMLEDAVGDFKTPLWILMGAVGFVLLLACSNVAGLLLVRASARQKEIAVRVALGAGTRRVVRQLLTESVLLALCGGLAGLLLTPWLLKAIVVFGAEALPRVVSTSIDRWALLFTTATAVGTGLFFGLAPAIQASRGVRYEVLKEGGRSSAEGHRSRRLGRVFVIAQAAFALILLTGSGLLMRSFVRVLAVDPGFRPEGVLTLQVLLPQEKYPKPEQWSAFFQNLTDRVGHLPGVEAAGGISGLPLGGQGGSGTVMVDASGVSPDQAFPEADRRIVTPGYFRAMGISLASGRFFEERDNRNSEPVAIIDESMASTYWPGQDAIGKRIKRDGGGSESPWMKVVGVVRHVRYRTLEARSRVQVYWPQAQSPFRGMDLAVRAKGDPLSLARAIEKEVLALDPQQPVDRVRTMQAVMADSLASRRLATTLFGLFAGMAVLLAAFGIYAVTAYAVTQRRQEIGLRLALGASRSDVFQMVISQGMALTLTGLGAGLLASLALTRLLDSLLYSVHPNDPATLAGAVFLLALIALLACWLPAWRATRVDPMVALRNE